MSRHLALTALNVSAALAGGFVVRCRLRLADLPLPAAWIPCVSHRRTLRSVRLGRNDLLTVFGVNEDKWIKQAGSEAGSY